MLSRTPSSGSSLPSLLDDDEHRSMDGKVYWLTSCDTAFAFR